MKFAYGKRSLSGKLYFRKLHNKIPNWDEFRVAYDKKFIDQKIPYKRLGQIYTVPIKIAGRSLEYIIDSGASDLVISSTLEQELRGMGVLRNSDYLSPQVYTLADGSSKTFRRVTLPAVIIGGTTINDVNGEYQP